MVDKSRADEAYDMALVAKTKIEQHEVICAQRYESIVTGMKGINTLLWGTAGAIIMVLCTGFGVLAFHIMTR